VITIFICSGVDAAGIPIQHRMVVLGMQVYFFPHEILVGSSSDKFYVMRGF